MKKLLLVFLCAVLCLLPACTDDEGSDSLKVVATNFPSYDFVRQLVSGTDAEVTMLLPPGGESHSYDPTPKDIVTISVADLFVCVGGTSDTWVGDVIHSAGNESLPVFRLTEHAELFFSGEDNGDHVHSTDGSGNANGHNADESDHTDAHGTDAHGEYDEHVWTSPKNVMGICRDLCEELCRLDPKSAEIFRANLGGYLSELEALDCDLRAVVTAGQHDTVVFADRFPLIYFTTEYSLNYLAAFPGCSSAVETSAGAIATLIDRVKEDRLPAVFHIELSNTDICETVAEECGVRILQFNACHNLTAAQFESGATYLSLMRENVAALKIALG